MSITWPQAVARSDIITLQEPASRCEVTKADFASAFEKYLITLDGSAHERWFDHYFAPSTDKPTFWTFRSKPVHMAFTASVVKAGCDVNVLAKPENAVEEDEEDEDADESSDEESEARDLFVDVAASPIYAAVAAVFASSPAILGDKLTASVKSALGGVESRLAAAVVVRALMQHLITISKLNAPAEWTAPEQFGALLASLLYGDDHIRDAVVGLSEIQRACAAQGMPAGLIQSIFVQLHQHDVVESSGFFAWRNDHGLTVAVPGKRDAALQLAKWFDWLDESEDDDDDEEEEEEEEEDGEEEDEEDDLLANRPVYMSLGRVMVEPSITWARAFKSKGVLTIEDPLLDTPVDKMAYARIYGPFLDTLDGGDMTSFFDFFFESSPGNATHWVFKDEDLREDFRDGCRDLKCLPSMRAAQEGEDEEDKAVRKRKEAELEAKAAADKAAAKKGNKGSSRGGAGALNDGLDDLFDRSGAGGGDDFDDGKDEATLAAEEEELLRQEAEAAAEEARKQAERVKTMEAQRAKLGDKKKASALTGAAKKREQMQASLNELQVKLANPALTEAEKAKLNEKADKIIAMLEQTM